MIFSFTGSMSTGKTTLLDECRKYYGDTFLYVDEITRTVKNKYNLPINELALAETQLLIINRHLENSLIKTDKHILMDRCIVDGLVYTRYLCLYNPKLPMWLGEYAKNVYDLIISNMSHIFYTSPRGISLAYDGVRSSNTDFRDGISNMYEQFQLHQPELFNKVTVLNGSVEERMQQIKNKLCQYGIGC